MGMKAGKYTAALVLLAVGIALIVDLSTGRNVTETLLRWWPVVLIALGVEYLVLSLVSRESGKKLGIAFGSLFFAAAISLAALAVSGAAGWQSLLDRVGQFGWFGDASSYLSEEDGLAVELEPVRTAVDGGVESVLLRNRIGSVTIRAGDVEAIEVRGTVRVPESAKNAADIARRTALQVGRDGGRIEMAVQGGEYRVFGIKQRPRVDLAVTVPRGLKADWHLDLTSGKVDAAGLKVRDRLRAETVNGEVVLEDIDGDVTADSTRGGITVRNVRGSVIANTTFGRIFAEKVSGDVTADTANGGVELRDIGGRAVADTTNGEIVLERIGGDAKADTTNGAIFVTEAGGAVKADTTNGDVLVRTGAVNGDYRLGSTNGNIQLYLPKDASIEVRGQTSWGTIETDFPLQKDGREVKGTAGGGAHKISIETNRNIGIYAN